MHSTLAKPRNYGALLGSDVNAPFSSNTLHNSREASIADFGAGNPRLIRGTVARSGRWYVEFDVISGPDLSGYCSFGTVMETTSSSVILYGSSADRWGGGDDAAYFNLSGAGRLMLAVDTIDRKVWIGKNGVWITNDPNSTVTPFATMASTVCGPLAPAFGNYSGAGQTNRAAICFTRDQMLYSPPLNFIPIGEF